MESSRFGGFFYGEIKKSRKSKVESRKFMARLNRFASDIGPLTFDFRLIIK